jgi:hypothetical protein
VVLGRANGPTARSIDALLAAGLEVVVVPATGQATACPLRRGAGNNDDRFDAYVLADMLRTDGHRSLR